MRKKGRGATTATGFQVENGGVGGGERSGASGGNPSAINRFS